MLFPSSWFVSEQIISNKYRIIALHLKEDNFSFWLFDVYAFNDGSSRASQWRWLDSLNLKWEILLCGDFNMVLEDGDRNKGLLMIRGKKGCPGIRSL